MNDVTPRRDVACAICGLFVCAHLAVLGVTEAAHLHEHETRQAIETAALPPEPDHSHQDFSGSFLSESESVFVNGTSGEVRALTSLAPHGVPMAAR